MLRADGIGELVVVAVVTDRRCPYRVELEATLEELVKKSMQGGGRVGRLCLRFNGRLLGSACGKKQRGCQNGSGE
jgi:hypothetical protein